MEKLFTIELDQRHEILEIHLNKLGAEYLRNILSQLVSANKEEHVHLMTFDFGGDELSMEQQNLGSDVKLMNHLKIMYWN